ncbi:glycosyltransferase family 2 protein [uncultured Chryseobacterium sp.]|uniref:glycosyltransferase family 2 protein n=1 Tax=uncultured Chryseobacterium sp. TaxID=259322 RepID=UPI0025E48499|nr:glycosyltransferase family 2 protein [uncultured Chryseobacterium sp.]
MIFPKISVVTISYAHEKYIIDTIEGIMMQEYPGEIEFILANDNSPDRSDEIIKKYLQENKIPINITVCYTKHTENKGMMRNFEWALNQATGKYIAICEGDDYWTDPLKLRKQVSFMEANPDFTMCFHKVDITMSDENDFFSYKLPDSDILYLNDIVKNHYIPTCSLVYRNHMFPNGFPNWFSSSISGDIPLEVLLASKGKTKYLTDVMACYRRNNGGISKSPKQIAKTRAGYISMYNNLANEIEFKSASHLRYLAFRLKLGYIKVFLKKLLS